MLARAPCEIAVARDESGERLHAIQPPRSIFSRRWNAEIGTPRLHNVSGELR